MGVRGLVLVVLWVELLVGVLGLFLGAVVLGDKTEPRLPISASVLIVAALAFVVAAVVGLVLV